MNIWVFIYRFSWSLVGILLLGGLAYVFYKPTQQFNELQEKRAHLQDDIRAKQEMVVHLRNKQERLLNDPSEVEKIAREDLGLAKPGEYVFKFVDEESAAAPSNPPVPAEPKNRR